jgi:hypothetical protein
MVFTPLETVGLASFFSLVTGTVIKIWDSNAADKLATTVEEKLQEAKKELDDCVSHKELDGLKAEWDHRCEEKQRLCSGHQVLGELKGIRALLQVLCEKATISAREQQEIVRDAK